MNLFRRKAQAELPPISLADEAISIVGFHDAMRAQNLSDLREWRRRLASNIEAETKALAAVDEQIARDEAVAELDLGRDKPRLAAVRKAKAEPVREAATYSGPGEVPKPADAPPVEDDPAFDEIEDEELDEVA